MDLKESSRRGRSRQRATSLSENQPVCDPDQLAETGTIISEVSGEPFVAIGDDDVPAAPITVESASPVPEYFTRALSEMSKQLTEQMSKQYEQISKRFSEQDSKFSERDAKLSERDSKLSEQISRLSERISEQESRQLERESRLSERLSEQMSSQLSEQMSRQFSEQESRLSGRISEQISKSTEENKKFINQLVENTNIRFTEVDNKIDTTISLMESKTNYIQETITRMENDTAAKINQVEMNTITLIQEVGDATYELKNKVEQNSSKLNTLQTQVENIHTITENKLHLNKTHLTEIFESHKDLVNDKLNSFNLVIENLPNQNVLNVPIAPMSTPTNLKFCGNLTEHPCSFIKRVENHFALYPTSENRKVQMVSNLLEDSARAWWDTLDSQPLNMEEFKTLFLNRYWNHTVQIEHKLDIVNSSWNRQKGLMCDYATQKAAALKLCNPPMTELEIIGILTRHFPLQIQNLLKSVQPQSIQQFLTLLGGYDQTYESLKSNNNSSRMNAIQYVVENGDPLDPQLLTMYDFKRRRKKRKLVVLNNYRSQDLPKIRRLN